MKNIKNFEKFNQSRMSNFDINQRILWSDVKKGVQILKYESLTEGLLTNLLDKAADGFKSIASKIPAVRNFFQKEEVKDIAYSLLNSDNIDEMLKIVYEKIKKEKGEITPTTIAEIAEQEEQRPEIFALIDRAGIQIKQKTEPTTNEKKLIVKSLLELMLLSLSIKASKTKDNQSDFKLDKTEMLKILNKDRLKSAGLLPKNPLDGWEEGVRRLS